MGEGALIEFEHPAAVKITAKTKMYRTNLVIPPYFFKYIRQYISESAFIISVGVRDKTEVSHTARSPDKACSLQAHTAAFSADIPCAKNAAVIPASISPVPAVAIPGLPSVTT